MAKHLKEVWQACDGTIHDSEAAATHHEQVCMKQKAVNSLADSINEHFRMNECYRRDGSHPRGLRMNSSQLEHLLASNGFVYEAH